MLSRVWPAGIVDAGASIAPFKLGLVNESGNPARGALVFLCTAPGTTRARIELYDVSGRLLRAQTLARGPDRQRVVLAGPQEIPSGVVFVRLTQGRDLRWLRVVVTQ